MPKYFARKERFNDQSIFTVYETDGETEVAVWEGRNLRETRKAAEVMNATATRISQAA